MPEDRSTEALVDALLRLGRLTRGLQHDGDLNPAQWEALRFLVRANRYSRSPTALAAYLGATKGTVSQTLLALERKGLVRRMQDRRDGRALWLSLTPKRERKLTHDPVGRVVDAAARVSEAARVELVDSLLALFAGIQRVRGHRAFGVCVTCRHFRRNEATDAIGGPHRCGLTGEALSDDDAMLICVEQESRVA